MKAVLRDNNDVNCGALLEAQFYGYEVLANVDEGAGSRKTGKLSHLDFILLRYPEEKCLISTHLHGKNKKKPLRLLIPQTSLVPLGACPVTISFRAVCQYYCPLYSVPIAKSQPWVTELGSFPSSTVLR